MSSRLSLRFDEEKNFVAIKLTGLLDPEDITEAFDRAVTSDQYKKGMSRLWDLTEADMTKFQSDAVRELALFSSKYPPYIHTAPVALVASRSLEFGFCRMFEMSCKETIPVQTFKSLQEAVEWLTARKNTQED